MRKLTILALAAGLSLSALPALAIPAADVDGVTVTAVEPIVADDTTVLPVPEPIAPTEPPSLVEPDPVEPLPVEPQPVDPVPVGPPVTTEPVDPLPVPALGGVGLEGDVFLPGRTVPGVLFSIIWDLEDPGHVQLWALWEGRPELVCDGRVIDGPVFLGRSDLLAGTCLIGKSTEGTFPLFILGDDGGWAFSVLRPTDRVPPVIAEP